MNNLLDRAYPQSTFRREQNEQSPGHDFLGRDRANHRLGTTVELQEFVTCQGEEEQTATTPGRSQNATGNPTDGIMASPIKKLQVWWSRNVRLNLEHGAPGSDPRDYLALERTFLGWFRTSLSLISFGVVIIQLFILKDVGSRKGKVIGVIMCCGGIIAVLLGCVRYLKQQRLLTQGKALSGGWHYQILIITLLVVLITLFVFVIIDS